MDDIKLQFSISITAVLLAILGAFSLIHQTQPDKPSDAEVDVSHGHNMMLAYFASEIDCIRGRWFEDIHSIEDWEQKRPFFVNSMPKCSV